MVITVTNNDNFLSILQKIRSSLDEEFKVTIPVNHPLLDNVLNLRLLKNEVEKSGKKITFEGSDEFSNNLLSNIFGERAAVTTLEVVKSASTTSGFKVPSWPTFNSRFKPRKFAVLFGGFLLLGILAIIALLWIDTNVPRATVSLKFTEESLVKNIAVTLDGKAALIDAPNHILPAQKIVVYATSSAQLATTGKKTEGDYARGKVIIYNKTDSQKTFPKNTLVSLVTTTSCNWWFTLDNDITVPERKVASVSATSEGQTTIYEYGQTKVNVTAKEYGDKFNLSADSQFNVGNESANDFLAKNEADFSGGRQVEVKVVTKDDQDKLLAKVTINLEDAVKLKLATAVPVGMVSATNGVYSKVVGTNFDRGISEKADNLNLTATAVGITYAFKEEDVKSLWQALVTTLLPQNYVLSQTEKELELSLLTTSLDTNKPQLQIKGTSLVVPKYVAADIQTTLAGRSLSDARTYLDSLTNIDTYKIEVWPPVLGLSNRMPKISGHITVEIQKD